MSVVEQDGEIWTYLSFRPVDSPACPDHEIFLQARESQSLSHEFPVRVHGLAIPGRRAREARAVTGEAELDVAVVNYRVHLAV
jgi:hypothetical protein